MESQNRDFFAGMSGVTLDELRRRLSRGRFPPKVNLYLVGGRWAVVLFSPFKGRGRWEKGKGDEYLMAETSGKPRRFASADTALRVVSRLTMAGGVYVMFGDFDKQGDSDVVLSTGVIHGQEDRE